MVGHRLGAALIDRANQLNEFLGLDLAGEAIAPERVGDLVKALFSFLPGRLVRVLERRDITLKQIRDGAGAGIDGDLDASAF